MSQPDLFSARNAQAAIPQADHRTGDVSGTYWNTTGLKGDELAEARRAASNQEAFVLALYRAARGPLSPSEALHRCEAAGKAWPLTSVRRAVTNLTKAGALVRLDSKRQGDYGRPEHEWGLAA